MANKQINELTEKSDVLKDDDLLLVYDSEEAGSEKTKKVLISEYISAVKGQPYYVYVDPAGNDTTGDGSIGNPFATPKGAYLSLDNKFIQASQYVWIKINDGTYNNLELFTILHPCSQRIFFRGSDTDPSQVVLNFNDSNSGFIVSNNSFGFFKGFTINAGSSSGAAFASFKGSYIYVSSCVINGWVRGLEASKFGNIETESVDIDSCTYGVYANNFGGVFLSNISVDNSVTNDIVSWRKSAVYSYNGTFTGSNNTQLDGTINIE